MKSKVRLYLLLTALLISCRAESAKPVFVVTVHPLDHIIQEIVGTKGKVLNILPTGASPHTYTPKPSDMAMLNSALALIYVADNLDGWAAKLPSNKKLKLIDLLPKEFRLFYAEDGDAHSHNDGDKGHGEEKGTVDPHFWLDPMAVKAILPILADSLGKLSPENAATFKTNAATFAKRLDLLNRQIEVEVAGVKGCTVFQFHPSFNYFLKRYGLVYGGVIELSPGKEPTPQFLANLSKKIKDSESKSIFSEPQLPERPAKAISEGTNVMLFVIDPNGGGKGRDSYSDLMLYNAGTFKKALGK